MGIPGKSLGSYESQLQAGEAENPKARGAKTGMEAKGNWGREVAGHWAHAPNGPEHSDRGELCDQPNLHRSPGARHTHPKWLTQFRTNPNWDQQEGINHGTPPAPRGS